MSTTLPEHATPDCTGSWDPEVYAFRIGWRCNRCGRFLHSEQKGEALRENDLEKTLQDLTREGQRLR
jgi:tRNA(Ile2) C34 agmatinyltransferase TiaS